MLLIDEPEIALHPNAVRAAKSHLYTLARESGWQVMLSTHCPSFVDPTEDHTTIVRLTRTEADPSPRLYRSDEAAFTGDERERLRFLLQFDPSVAELFFGSYPIIVEGDTEYAAFLHAVATNASRFPVAHRPVVVRSIGKGMIVPLMKLLRHFKISFSVLHDSDSPMRKGGRSGQWTENWKIAAEVAACRNAGLRVVHRVSIPDIERRFGFTEGDASKPFEMWTALQSDASASAICADLLEELLSEKSSESVLDATNFETSLTAAVKEWSETHAKGDPRFTFAVV